MKFLLRTYVHHKITRCTLNCMFPELGNAPSMNGWHVIHLPWIFSQLEQCICKYMPTKNQKGLILVNIKVQHPYHPTEVFFGHMGTINPRGIMTLKCQTSRS